MARGAAEVRTCGFCSHCSSKLQREYLSTSGAAFQPERGPCPETARIFAHDLMYLHKAFFVVCCKLLRSVCRRLDRARRCLGKKSRLLMDRNNRSFVANFVAFSVHSSDQLAKPDHKIPFQFALGACGVKVLHRLTLVSDGDQAAGPVFAALLRRHQRNQLAFRARRGGNGEMRIRTAGRVLKNKGRSPGISTIRCVAARFQKSKLSFQDGE